MAITSKITTETVTTVTEKLILNIEDSELDMMNDMIEKWCLKDYESLILFCLGLLSCNDDKHFTLHMDGRIKHIVPSLKLLKS